MSKHQMIIAREMIKEKRYDEARALLKTVDHPTARDWLAKLDKIAPEKTGFSLSTIPYSYLIGSGVVVTLAVVVILLVLTRGPGSNLTETFSYAGMSFRYPKDWSTTIGQSQITLLSPANTEVSDDQPPDHEISIFVIREVGPNKSPTQVADSYRKSLSEGFTDLDGNVLIPPVEASPLSPVSFDGFSGVVFTTTWQEKAVAVYTLDTGNRTLSSFISATNDPAYLDPLLVELIKTYNFDPSLAGDFACPVASWWEDSAGSLVTRFLDTSEVAAQTSRIALSPLVLEMQRIHRDFEGLDYPSCVSEVRNKLLSAMDTTIEGFTSFVGQSDYVASAYLDMAAEEFAAVRDMLRDDMGFFGTDIRLGMMDVMW